MNLVIRTLALAPVLAILSACENTMEPANSAQGVASTNIAASTNGSVSTGTTGGVSSATGPTTNDYTVGGTASGILGSGLVLQDNGGNNLGVSASGNFTFNTAIASGSAYSVTVLAQPSSPAQTCVISGGSGTVASANVANVQVNCTTNTYTIGGVVSTLKGSGLVLQDNGGNNLGVSASGNFTFNTAIASGSAYSVTVLAQPSSPAQTCVISGGSGTVASANVANVRVTCTTNAYTVGGVVSGLTGSGLALRINGGTALPLAANGAFTFPTSIPSGNSYLVTLAAQPSNPSQTCVLAGASNTVASSAISDVVVTCTSAPTQFAYLGSHTGIYCFAVDAISSALVQLAIPLCDSGILTAVAVDPTGQFVYATDAEVAGAPPPPAPTHGAVRMYRIDSGTGALVPLDATEPSTQWNPVAIAADPSGHFVYAANYGSDSISGYAIDLTTGILTTLSGSPFGTGHLPNAIAIDPSGRFLYTANQYGSYNVSAFTIDATTGNLTPVPGSPFAAGTAATAITTDPAGRFVFVANLNSSNVSAFTIGSTGALAPVPGSPFFAAGSSPSGVAVDANGAFLYVANGSCSSFGGPGGITCDDISGYSIDQSSGTLTPLQGSPFPAPGGAYLATVRGPLLYVSNNYAGTIFIFAIDEVTGDLQQISGSPVTASGSGATGTYNISFAP